MSNAAERRRIIYICLAIWAIMISTFIFSLILSKGYSFKSLFFLRTIDCIMDFSNSIRDSSGNDVYSYFHSMYPPIAVLYFRFLSLFYDPSVIAKETSKYLMWEQPMLYVQFVLFLLSCAFIIAFAIKRKCKYLNIWSSLFVFAFVCLSFPFIYAIERGNIIILSLALIIFFVCCYKDKNKVIHELSIFTLALSIAIKMYPVIFALFLVKEKDIKNLVKAGIYTVLMYFLPFCFYGGMNDLIVLITTPFRYFSRTVSDTNNSVRAVLLHLTIISVDGFIYKYINYLFIIYFSFLAFKSKKQYLIILCLGHAMLHLPGTEGTYATLFLLPAFVLLFDEENLDLIDFICMIWFILVFSVNGLFNDAFNSYSFNYINLVATPVSHFIVSYAALSKNKRPLVLTGNKADSSEQPA